MTSPVTDATIAIARYHAKPGNEVGGNLHIVLDDPNYDERSVRFCLDYAARMGDEDGVELARQLLKLSYSQRKKAVSKYWQSPH